LAPAAATERKNAAGNLDTELSAVIFACLARAAVSREKVRRRADFD
jgi:hypothetical protein